MPHRTRNVSLSFLVGLSLLVPCASARAALPAAASARAVVLVEGGQPRCTIVVPQRASAEIAAAAEDLQAHLRMMSGALVPVEAEGKPLPGRGIYLGVQPAWAHLPAGVDLANARQFWPDGYLILTDPRGICLLSPRPEGVVNAVYALLEEHLGCHWFAPGEVGTSVPSRKTVRVRVAGGHQVSRPTFELRTPWYNANALGTQTKRESRDMAIWRTRNRAGGMRGYAGQDWISYFPTALQIKEPGLQALVNGKRAPRGAEAQICMAYPRAVEIAAQALIAIFKGHPELDDYTFSPNDNDVWCQCPECMALGKNPAERMLVFSNRVAERVAAECPGKGITILPYSSTIEPPTGPIKGAPNLYPVICSYSMEQVKPKTADTPWCNEYRRRVERWMQILPRAWSYDYMGWYPGPWPVFHKLEQEQTYYRKLGFSGIMPEYLDRNMGTDLHMWLSFRIAWDGSKRVDGLLAEFYPRYYGAAATTMRGIFERFEKHMLATGGSGEVMEVPRLYPLPMVEEALRQIAQARQKVAGDPVILARLDRDQHCLELTRLFLAYWATSGQLRRSGKADDRAKAIAAAEAYLREIGRLDGTLTVGQTTRAYVQRGLSDMNDPGTVFSKAGPFSYADGLDDGGKSYMAKSRTGFGISTYGLALSPGATGQITYDMRATGGLRFAEARLTNTWLTLPPGGHNSVEVSVDEGKSWSVAYHDVRMVASAEYDLTGLVSGKTSFLLRFTVQSGADEALALDGWGISGVLH